MSNVSKNLFLTIKYTHSTNKIMRISDSQTDDPTISTVAETCFLFIDKDLLICSVIISVIENYDC